MAKTLYMRFRDAGGSLKTISLRDPKDNLTDAEVDAFMDTVIAENVFTGTGGDLTTKVDAYVRDTADNYFTLIGAEE